MLAGPCIGNQVDYASPMSDDWRLRIDLQQPEQIQTLNEHLETAELQHDLETEFHDRLVVSRDAETLFCYAGSREQAARADALVRSVAAEHGWQLESVLQRWHESAEQWEDPEVPLPETDAERAAERADLLEREREESEEQGYPEFEVRVQFDSHREAVAFGKRLEDEGLPCVRRWKYLVVGAPDEDSATELAERLRAEAGPRSTVTAEGSGKDAYNERPTSPFWFLGGLGG